ncbi:flavoprotein [Streptomyces sp. NPDC002734]|uniref:flavoprotein n=1 Tax=Streptomyces sp. NPDC002734 TaxID=3154426 RepID=UPI00331FEA44
MTTTRTLYVIGCAAPPLDRLDVGVRLAREAGWRVCVLLTPAARRWVGDPDALAARTGASVRWEYGAGADDALPAPDALLAAPLTVNSLARWACAMCDSRALLALTEGLGRGLPAVALPYFNDALAAHPAVARHVAFLREAGVRVLLGEGGFVPHPPREDDVAAYPWQAAVDALPR